MAPEEFMNYVVHGYCAIEDELDPACPYQHIPCRDCPHWIVDNEEYDILPCREDIMDPPEPTIGKEIGLKYDDGKPRLDLIDPHFMGALGTVLAYGANKYGDRNWEKGIKYSRLFAALQRHLWAFWSGIDDDHESGLPHLWHAATNLMMLVAIGSQWDDRVGEP
jgi:hypothetical protein